MTVPLVLIVDPDPDIRAVLSMFLHAAGHRVVMAGSATAAFGAARRLKPDVVVGEHPLLLEDGRTLCSALRADPETAGTPFVAVTAGALAAEVEDARRWHEAVFIKPPDYGELLRVVGELAARPLVSRSMT